MCPEAHTFCKNVVAFITKRTGLLRQKEVGSFFCARWVKEGAAGLSAQWLEASVRWRIGELRLRRIPLPRTRVNKGKKKARSVEAPILPPPARCPPFLELRSSTSRRTLQGELSQRGVHLSLRGLSAGK